MDLRSPTPTHRSNASRRRLIQRLQSSPSKEKCKGAVFPFVILTVFVVVIGAVTLATRSSESKLSSIRQSDMATAREAAEYGMNEVVGRLNTNAQSYLLVTDFGTGGSGWNSVGSGDLATCRIQISGSPSASSVVGSQSLPTLNTARYEVTAYTAPQLVAGATKGTGCSKFGNLYGGLASITVRGSLQSPSGTEVASYSLTRRIHVIGPKGGGSSIGQYPLIVLGSGSRLDKAVGDFVSASSPGVSVSSATQVNIGCLLGVASSCLNPTPPTTPPTTGVDDLSALAMPTFPTPTSLGDPTSRDPNAVTVTAAITQANDDVYPYSTAVPGTISGVSAALRPECKLNSGSTAINCLVNTISTTANNARIRIDTSYYPVNIFVRGAISFQRGSEIGAKPVINNTSVSDWNKLRIYGNNSGSSCATQSTANSFTQSISVGGSAAFKGAFSWFPKARISYGTGGGGGSDVTNFGIMWICRFDGPGSENQAWGAPLDASAGIGTIFGTAFGGSSDTLTPSAIPSSPSYYRSYGAS